MTRWLGLLVLGALCACNAGDVVVFIDEPAAAAGQAGSGGAGSSGAAGSGGSGGMAGSVAGGGSAGDAPVAGSSGDSGYTCTNNDDCPGPGWLCSKSTCGSASGLCKPRPLECEASHAPVCGCDGITFWNDCLREQRGEPSSTMGDCGANAKPCKDDSECAGGNCAKQVPNPDACGQPGRGVCFVTPPECVVAPESHWWFACSSLPGGAAPCLTTCQAVQTGQPFVGAPKGACP